MGITDWIAAIWGKTTQQAAKTQAEPPGFAAQLAALGAARPPDPPPEVTLTTKEPKEATPRQPIAEGDDLDPTLRTRIDLRAAADRNPAPEPTGIARRLFDLGVQAVEVTPETWVASSNAVKTTTHKLIAGSHPDLAPKAAPQAQIAPSPDGTVQRPQAALANAAKPNPPTAPTSLGPEPQLAKTAPTPAPIDRPSPSFTTTGQASDAQVTPKPATPKTNEPRSEGQNTKPIADRPAATSRTTILPTDPKRQPVPSPATPNPTAVGTKPQVASTKTAPPQTPNPQPNLTEQPIASTRPTTAQTQSPQAAQEVATPSTNEPRSDGQNTKPIADRPAATFRTNFQPPDPKPQLAPSHTTPSPNAVRPEPKLAQSATAQVAKERPISATAPTPSAQPDLSSFRAEPQVASSKTPTAQNLPIDLQAEPKLTWAQAAPGTVRPQSPAFDPKLPAMDPQTSPQQRVAGGIQPEPRPRTTPNPTAFRPESKPPQISPAQGATERPNSISAQTQGVQATPPKVTADAKVATERLSATLPTEAKPQPTPVLPRKAESIPDRQPARPTTSVDPAQPPKSVGAPPPTNSRLSQARTTPETPSAPQERDPLDVPRPTAGEPRLRPTGTTAQSSTIDPKIGTAKAQDTTAQTPTTNRPHPEASKAQTQTAEATTKATSAEPTAKPEPQRPTQHAPKAKAQGQPATPRVESTIQAADPSRHAAAPTSDSKPSPTTPTEPRSSTPHPAPVQQRPDARTVPPTPTLAPKTHGHADLPPAQTRTSEQTPNDQAPTAPTPKVNHQPKHAPTKLLIDLPNPSDETAEAITTKQPNVNQRSVPTSADHDPAPTKIVRSTEAFDQSAKNGARTESGAKASTTERLASTSESPIRTQTAPHPSAAERSEPPTKPSDQTRIDQSPIREDRQDPMAKVSPNRNDSPFVQLKATVSERSRPAAPAPPVRRNPETPASTRQPSDKLMIARPPRFESGIPAHGRIDPGTPQRQAAAASAVLTQAVKSVSKSEDPNRQITGSEAETAAALELTWRPETRVEPTVELQRAERQLHRAHGEAVDRVQQALEQLLDAKKEGTIRIHLRPDDLGSVTIKVSFSGGHASAEIVASDEGLRQVLDQHRQSLSPNTTTTVVADGGGRQDRRQDQRSRRNAPSGSSRIDRHESRAVPAMTLASRHSWRRPMDTRA